MQELLNAMAARRDAQDDSKHPAREGMVTSYDPDNYCVKVMLMPDMIETGWLRISTPWSGNGFGMFAPPMQDDVVEVHFQEGDLQVGFVTLRAFNDVDRPLRVDAGEMWLVHKSGSFYKLTNEGKVLINGQVEIDATAPTINITATGNITATAGGNATVEAAGTATIKAPSIVLKSAGAALKSLCTELFMQLFNDHDHECPDGTTGKPNQQAVSGTHTTNIVKAE